MEVTFSINFDLGKNNSNSKHEKQHCSCHSNNEESNLEKWLETAQQFVKSIRVK